MELRGTGRATAHGRGRVNNLVIKHSLFKTTTTPRSAPSVDLFRAGHLAHQLQEARIA
jgi:hypothetical protein